MENPCSINRFLLALLVVATLVAVAASIYFQNLYILAGWFSAVGAGFVLWGFFALLNIALFAPLFRLLAKLDAKIGRNELRGE
jgi:hypothetical protein